jgi:hypothetical protein
MKEIGIREFRDRIHRHIREGKDIAVTKGKEVIFVVTFPSKEKISGANVVTIDNVGERVEEIVKGVTVGNRFDKVSEYGCGCERESGKHLCSKHWRY